MTKDAVRQSLSTLSGAAPGTTLITGEHVLWVSACETFISVRLQWPRAGEFDRLAAAAYGAVVAGAAAGGEAVASFIVELVDEGGKVVATRRWGGLTAAESNVTSEAGAAAGAGMRGPSGGAPGSPSAGAAGAGAAGAGPSGGGAGSAGHKPIPGLDRAAGEAGGIVGNARVIAVGAGKGGVGKSTIALNLAVGLARLGKAVGLLDADIYGPSMPTMLGLDGLDAVVRQKMLEPFYTHGVKAMTMGKLVAPEQPLIWRGPMAHGAFKQLLEQTNWGTLDYLIIDLPPGTGDVALTMAQSLQLAGAVVVCTPQKVAQDDAVRATKMFKQLNIEVLGVVENMSYFVGDDGKVYDIFGRGGAQVMAQRLGVPYLGAVPITMSLRANSDNGDPTANFTGKDDAGKRLTSAFEELVRQVEGQVNLAAMRGGGLKPSLKIS